MALLSLDKPRLSGCCFNPKEADAVMELVGVIVSTWVGQASTGEGVRN